MTAGRVGRERISIIIPTRNRRADLLRAIDSILIQTLAPAEIVVVDQSVDEEPRIAAQQLLHSRPEISVVYLRRPDLSGLTAAKNLGVDSASGDILLFIDDDVILEPDFLEHLSGAYDRSDYDGIGGVFLPDDSRGGLRHRFARLFRTGPFRDDRLLLQYAESADELRPTWLLSGGLSSCRKRIFEKVRFNEALHGASPVEDVDFYSRASKHFRFALASRARAIHNVSKDVRLSSKDFFTAKCQVFALYYQNYVPKTRRNYLSYLWLRLGLLSHGIAASLRTRDTGAVIGAVRGWRTASRGVTEDDVLGAR